MKRRSVPHAQQASLTAQLQSLTALYRCRGQATLDVGDATKRGTQQLNTGVQQVSAEVKAIQEQVLRFTAAYVTISVLTRLSMDGGSHSSVPITSTSCRRLA